MTRYFGGILLGTGGLVKAYSAATMEALKKAQVIEKALGKEVRIVVNYADLEKLKYYLKQNDVKIVNTTYGENVEIVAEMVQEKWEAMLEKKESLNFVVLECEVLEEKFIGV